VADGSTNCCDLDHPNIVPIYDILKRPEYGLVMPLLEGQSLQDVLRGVDRLPAAEVKGRSSTATSNPTTSLSAHQRQCETLRLWRLHAAYMSPEAWTGHYGPSCDLWSIGVVMFQCLSGRLPFPRADSTREAPAIQLRAEDEPVHAHSSTSWPALSPCSVPTETHPPLPCSTAPRCL